MIIHVDKQQEWERHLAQVSHSPQSTQPGSTYQLQYLSQPKDGAWGSMRMRPATPDFDPRTPSTAVMPRHVTCRGKRPWQQAVALRHHWSTRNNELLACPLLQCHPTSTWVGALETYLWVKDGTWWNTVWPSDHRTGVTEPALRSSGSWSSIWWLGTLLVSGHPGGLWISVYGSKLSS